MALFLDIEILLKLCRFFTLHKEMQVNLAILFLAVVRSYIFSVLDDLWSYSWTAAWEKLSP